MEYRRLGKTGLQLGVLSFGSWVTFHKQIDDKLVDTLMGIAYDSGINFFDNAESYALGESEKMMGRVLKQKGWERSSFVVSSKAFFGCHGKHARPNQRGLSRKHLVEACNEALQRLQVDYLDLYFCHRPDKQTPVEEVVWTMNLLLQQGKILYWGTSEWSAQEIMEAHMVAQQYRLVGPAMEQPEYNLFNRHKMEKEYLQIFRHIGMGATIWSPLASGLLTGKYNNGIPENSRLALSGFEWLKNKTFVQDKIEKVEKLEKLALNLNTTVAALSLAWCIRNPYVTTAILGATRAEQLIENLKALDIYDALTLDIMEEIDAIMGTAPLPDEY